MIEKEWEMEDKICRNLKDLWGRALAWKRERWKAFVILLKDNKNADWTNKKQWLGELWNERPSPQGHKRFLSYQRS